MGKFKEMAIDEMDHAQPEDPDEGDPYPGIPRGYITGLGRDVPHPKLAHLYKGDFSDPGLGMCRYAYNRKEYGYSIWRGNEGEHGICKICYKRAMKGLDGIENPYYTETMRKEDEELERIMAIPPTPEEQAQIDAILRGNK